MDSKIHRLLSTPEKGSTLFWVIVGIVSIGLLGILDYLTGIEFTFSLFYLAPIILVTWFTDLKVGIFMSLLSALVLSSAEIAAGQRYTHVIIYFLNTLVRALFYTILIYFVVELKKSQRKEQLAARTDFVTKLANRRYFDELLETEVERIRRYPHPITVVYMDMDNFKLVNDLFGHEIGDEVLRSIASELKAELRTTDTIARLGGDEFALLLPSTRQADAQVIIQRVRTHLAEAMRRRDWPVTFSMGAVVCQGPPFSAKSLIDMADELMYEVKNSTKDGILCAAWDGKKFHRLEP